MKRTLITFASAIGLAIGFAASAAVPDITPSERDKAVQYLADTSKALVAATKGLSEAQWKFKPAPDRWSVAEVVEHLALLEDLFANKLSAEISAAPAGKLDAAKVDANILAKVPDRSTKFQAPDYLVPTGRWTPSEALEHFLADRRKTVSFLTSMPDLRSHVMNHPALGPMDGYEWVLAIAAHTQRHTKQILEVKADPRFPETTGIITERPEQSRPAR
jgi:uncharacterized damage-inducible protein DinB